MLYSNLFSQLEWASHGFGTRSDTAEAPARRASLKQIHSDVVLLARGSGYAGEGDALISAEPGLELAVRTADCYPVLLADARRHAVAAIHAGWRGTAAGIAGKAIEKMQREFGTDPNDIYAAIGPGIGVCCFEVGPEVERLFHDSDAGSELGRETLNRPGYVNLAEANRRQLVARGVAPSRIDIIGLCTFCEAAQLFSYRREKQHGREETGRMTSYIRA